MKKKLLRKSNYNWASSRNMADINDETITIYFVLIKYKTPKCFI